MSDEFAELEGFGCDPTEAARLLADVREWRQANPGWESWNLDVRLTRFGLWLAARHVDTPNARLRLARDRDRARKDLLLE